VVDPGCRLFPWRDGGDGEFYAPCGLFVRERSGRRARGGEDGEGGGGGVEASFRFRECRWQRKGREVEGREERRERAKQGLGGVFFGTGFLGGAALGDGTFRSYPA